MNCSCIYTGVSHNNDLMFEEMRSARKEHKCTECKRVIHPKESYEYIRLKDEGGFYTAKTCVDCLSVRKAFFCDGYVFEEIWMDVKEHVRDSDGNISSECLQSLTKVARDKICDMIEDQWEEV